nr:MAG TPA: hypothetical protein [Caudoviricetes sp.]
MTERRKEANEYMEFKSPDEEQRYLFKVELPNLIARILLLSAYQKRNRERIIRDSEALKKASIQSIEACKNSLVKVSCDRSTDDINSDLL